MSKNIQNETIFRGKRYNNITFYNKPNKIFRGKKDTFRGKRYIVLLDDNDTCSPGELSSIQTFHRTV